MPHGDPYLSMVVGVGGVILRIKDIVRAETPQKEVRLQQGGDKRPFFVGNGCQDLMSNSRGPAFHAIFTELSSRLLAVWVSLGLKGILRKSNSHSLA